MIQLQNEKEELRHEVKELEAKLAIQRKIYNEYGVYWTQDASKHDGPFCTVCLDDKGRLVRMIDTGPFHVPGTKEEGRSYDCGVHKVRCIVPVRILKTKGLLPDVGVT